MQGDGSGRGMPQWVVSLIIMASCAALSLVMLAINRLVRYVQMRNAGAHACFLSLCMPAHGGGCDAAVNPRPHGSGFATCVAAAGHI